MKKLLQELSVDFASPVPVYEQIQRQIKHAIAKKVLVQQESMPSIREMAAYLSINPNTVARAYRELQQQGIISGRAGKGYWVETAVVPDEEKVEMIKQEFLRFLDKAVSMGLSAERIKELVDEFFGKKNGASE